MTAAELGEFLRRGRASSPMLSLHRDVVLEPNLFLREVDSAYRVIPSRNGSYSVVSDEFDQLNPVPIFGCAQLHTDGLYLDEVPEFSALYCQHPGEHGIGTIIADSRKAISMLRAQGLFDALQTLQLKYQFGDEQWCIRNLVQLHPVTGEPVLNLGPSGTIVETASYLDSASEGTPITSLSAVYSALEQSIVLHHYWSQGDLLMVDNNAFVHGRAFGPRDQLRKLLRIWISTR